MSDQPKFSNRKNGYYSIGDKQYVSVTTILQAVAKPMLIDWACRQGAKIQREEQPEDEKELLKLFRDISERAKTRGSNIHNFIEYYLKTKKFPPVKDNPYWESFRRFAGEHDLEPLLIEAQVHCHSFEFAGTCDYVGYIDGQLTVLDFKTNEKGAVYKEVELQLAAYRRALCDMLDEGTITIEGVDSKKLSEACLNAVAFSASNAYTLKSIPEANVNLFNIFLGVKQTWRWLNGR